MIPLNVVDLIDLASDLRSLVRATVAREPSMLSEALRTVAEYAETTAQRLSELDPDSPDPSELDRDDLTILVLLAGYATGREGIAAATDAIRRVTDTVETDPAGEAHE